ncbi:hypothetical protein [Agrobacterium arsenijevicii]|uniref:Pilus assembly protein n=1 Tax=Agrobacterium arsenijevicii TaxID=1585697 RepID=A0ABR5CZ68_9HYPH|nr:hypothetical protein RP75_28295 [Agrobacterium arsenijevicii]
MLNFQKKLYGLKGVFGAFLGDRRAAFAIMTALLLPLFILLIGLLFEGGRALAYYNQSKRVMALACERSTKPTRTDTPLDEVRRQGVLTTFDSMIQSTKQKVVDRDVTIDWLRTDISAQFSYGLVFADMFNLQEIKFRLSYSCEGIPPYPYDGEVIVDNKFENNLLGKERILNNGITKQTPGGCWGVYPYSELKWDGGAGPGVEMQDWSSPCCRKNHYWEGYPEDLSGEKKQQKETANDKACEIKDTVNSSKSDTKSDFSNAGGAAASLPTRYVIELDSDWGSVKSQGKKRTDANSSIFKYVELHPGFYEISVWYNGRRKELAGVADPKLTNGIAVSLQRLLPQLSEPKTIFDMSQDKSSIKWKQYRENITVDTYSMYKLTIAAAGLSDSVGGIITGFELKYIGRYGDERR